LAPRPITGDVTSMLEMLTGLFASLSVMRVRRLVQVTWVTPVGNTTGLVASAWIQTSLFGPVAQVA
jgi:hypothetical protein